MDSALHTRLIESPVYFTAGSETLFGILTRPTDDPVDTIAIVLTGAGFPSTNRNRLSVHLCRTLADLGCCSLRFDYHGVGESTGIAHGFSLSRPFVQDLEGAVEFVKGQGFKRLIFIGSCFGARTAVTLVPRVPELAGLALIGAPIHEDRGADAALRLSTADWVRKGAKLRTLRKLFNAKHRGRYASIVKSKMAMSRSNSAGASTKPFQTFFHSITTTLGRQAPVLFIYGLDDRFYHQFRKATRSNLGNALTEAGDLVQIVKIDGEVHGFTRIDVQTRVIEIIDSWFRTKIMSESPRSAELS